MKAEEKYPGGAATFTPSRKDSLIGLIFCAFSFVIYKTMPSAEARSTDFISHITYIMDLSEENEHLKKLLKEKEQDVILAGKYGCELLESNTFLSEKLDELSQNYSTQVKVQDLDTELSEATLKIIHLSEELQLSKDHLLEAKDRLSNVVNTQNQPQEVNEIYERYNIVIDDKQNLESALNKSKLENEKLKLQIDQDLRKRCLINQELEEKECQISSYINAVEKARLEKFELQVEMDAMQFNNLDPNSKGNSLFAEVEDNRFRLQTQLLNLRVSYDALKKKSEFNQHQIVKMKHHMISLLGMSGNRVDSEHVAQLQNSLTQARIEIQELNNKLEKYETRNSMKFKCIPDNDIVKHSENKERSDCYFKLMITKSKEEIEKLKTELRSLRFAKMTETDSLLQCKQKLYTVERNANNYKAEFMKLKLKMEETSKSKDTVRKLNLNQAKKEKIPGFEPACKSEQSDSEKQLEMPISIEENCGQLKEINKELSINNKKKSVTICEKEQNKIENIKQLCEKENNIQRPSSKGHLVDVPAIDVREAKIECPQQ
ncbi:Protein Spindly-A [Nymphon striatum]|nr:Protein Spindly-A [Nymphon striatum]